MFSVVAIPSGRNSFCPAEILSALFLPWSGHKYLSPRQKLIRCMAANLTSSTNRWVNGSLGAFISWTCQVTHTWSCWGRRAWRCPHGTCQSLPDRSSGWTPRYSPWEPPDTHATWPSLIQRISGDISEITLSPEINIHSILRSTYYTYSPEILQLPEIYTVLKSTHPAKINTISIQTFMISTHTLLLSTHTLLLSTHTLLIPTHSPEITTHSPEVKLSPEIYTPSPEINTLSWDQHTLSWNHTLSHEINTHSCKFTYLPIWGRIRRGRVCEARTKCVSLGTPGGGNKWHVTTNIDSCCLFSVLTFCTPTASKRNILDSW